ncbi:MAG: DUF1127 domain-containing protein [Pseudomonadota bacterium]
MSHLSSRRSLEQAAPFETPIASPPSRLHRLGAMIRLWRERTAARRHLAVIDARSLRDAGISQAAASYESGKPFWRPFGPLR